MHRSAGAAETDDECDIGNLGLEMRAMRKAIARKKLDMAMHDEL
jgi:hypothetical protein